MSLPPVDQTYYAPEIETMPRADLEALQLERLLETLPHAYKNSALLRTTWDAAGVHPRDVRTLDDFRERVPFVDKDAVRHYRDEHGDPYGGLLCVPPSELSGVSSTSGTTGDPTLVPEQWGARSGGPSIITRDMWGWGVRPGDYVALVLFTFRGPTDGLFKGSLGQAPFLLDLVAGGWGGFGEQQLVIRDQAGSDFGSLA